MTRAPERPANGYEPSSANAQKNQTTADLGELERLEADLRHCIANASLEQPGWRDVWESALDTMSRRLRAAEGALERERRRVDVRDEKINVMRAAYNRLLVETDSTPRSALPHPVGDETP